ncbi:hypothetical protein D0859_09582 [Hortaea werneckii]|nr:hypothetical protein D0859_09582 [Hortaea werneckii]
MSGEAKISPHSLPDLKNTTDDALGNYLRGLNFQQDNSKLDTRLAIGYTSVLIAAATFVADYKLGWEATKGWTAVAVVCYGILNAAFTYWMWGVEKGLVFEGKKDGKHVSILPGAWGGSGKRNGLTSWAKISLASKTKKHEPTYFLAVTVTDSATNTPVLKELQAPFTTWFTADGYFVAKPFQQWLATSSETVGDADPKNASRVERDQLAAPSPEVEAVAGTAGDGPPAFAETSGASSGKGSKRSKRKG